MKRRVILVALVTGAISVVSAAPALAAHCENLSKQVGAGNHTTVVIDAATGEAGIDTLNGGWADVWLDTDGDGIGDVYLEEVMIGANHSPQTDHADPWVNPGAVNKTTNGHATSDHGMFVDLG